MAGTSVSEAITGSSGYEVTTSQHPCSVWNGVSDANEELAASQSENKSLKRQTAQYANVSAIYAAAAAAQTQLASQLAGLSQS